jgi:hypothetical protein
VPDSRASDRERKATVRVLRGQMREGRLSDRTFVRRLALALDARRRGELDQLVADLPSRSPLRRLAPAYRRLITLLRGIGPARLSWPPARRPGTGEIRELALPPVPGRYIIGRSDDVDLRLDDLSVSRHHAVLAHVDGGWVLSDLGSRNGTWLNGWRLPAPAPVVAGDLLDIACCRFRIVDRHAAHGVTRRLVAVPEARFRDLPQG